MITNRPFVQTEKDNGHRIYDVTVPIHDARGKMVATIGIDFKSEPNQSETQIAQRSVQIANELEAKISSKAKLFGPVD